MIPDVVHSQERAVLDGLNQFDGALTDQDGNGMGRGGGHSCLRPNVLWTLGSFSEKLK